MVKEWTFLFNSEANGEIVVAVRDRRRDRRISFRELLMHSQSIIGADHVISRS